MDVHESPLTLPSSPGNSEKKKKKKRFFSTHNIVGRVVKEGFGVKDIMIETTF